MAFSDRWHTVLPWIRSPYHVPRCPAGEKFHGHIDFLLKSLKIKIAQCAQREISQLSLGQVYLEVYSVYNTKFVGSDFDMKHWSLSRGTLLRTIKRTKNAMTLHENCLAPHSFSRDFLWMTWYSIYADMNEPTNENDFPFHFWNARRKTVLYMLTGAVELCNICKKLCHFLKWKYETKNAQCSWNLVCSENMLTT